MTNANSVYVLGIGNPAREDDGIGPAVIEAIEGMEIEGVTVEANYQLTVEDAATIAGYDRVIFVDASMSDAEPFSFEAIAPDRSDSFSTHSVLPKDVLGMARDMFHSDVQGFLLGIKGYSFRMFTEEMTEKARENCRTATDFLIGRLRANNYEQVTGGSS